MYSLWSVYLLRVISIFYHINCIDFIHIFVITFLNDYPTFSMKSIIVALMTSGLSITELW